MENHTFSDMGIKLIFSAISIIVSTITFFLIRHGLYGIALLVPGISAAYYFSYAKKLNLSNKLFLNIAFFLPLLIVCFLV